MANTQRFNWLQAQRVDVPHLKMIEDGNIFDFRALLSGFIGTSPYTLRGFYIPNAANYINAQASTIQVSVSDSVIWMPGQADGSYLTVPAGTPNEILNATNPNVVGSFTSGATNYVSVQLLRATDPSTNDLVSFWDVDAKVEFTKNVPLGLVLEYQIVINTSGFGTNMPLAIVGVNSSGAAISIENAKYSPFRLGQGGAAPNPYYTASLTAENPLIVTANGQPDPFQNGDFNLLKFKDWMDMVMSRILNLSGGSLWYVNGSSLIPGASVANLAFNAEFSVITGSGAFVHDPATAGLLEWTSNVLVRSIFGPLTYTITQGSVELNDGQVCYVSLVRDQDFQSSNTFSFTNGTNTITAANTISGISAGDWVKYAADNIAAYAKVSMVSGSTITLASNYIGTTVTGKALRCQGTYGTVTAADPTAVPVSGDTYWLAKRDDNAFTTLMIDTPANGGLSRASNYATVKTVLNHNLVVGQAITIAGANDSSFDGKYDIQAVTGSKTFTVYNPGPDVSGGSPAYTLVADGLTGATPAPSSGFDTGSITTQDWQGNNFSLGAGINLGKITVVGGNPMGTPTGNVYIDVYAASGNVPTGSVLASSDVVAATAITNLADIDFTFTGAGYPSLSAGNYVWMIKGTTADSFNAARLKSTGTPPQSAGYSVATTNGGVSYASANYTTYYQVYSETGGGIAGDGSVTATPRIYLRLRGGNGVLEQGDSAQIDDPTLLNILKFIGSESESDTSPPYTIFPQAGSPYTFSSADSLTIAISICAGNINSIFTTLSNPAYDESLLLVTSGASGNNQINGPITSGTNITLPLNSRNSNATQYYTVGKGWLDLFLNGQFLPLTNVDSVTGGWTEVGVFGAQSTTIQINQNLVVGDVLDFKIRMPGGPGTGGGAPDDDFVHLPTDSVANNSNYLLIYDVGLGAYRKQTRGVFLAGISNNRSFTTYSANHTISLGVDDFVLADASSASIIISLPSASSATGVRFTIKKKDMSANTVTVSGADNIDFAMTKVLTNPGDSIDVSSDGVQWWIN